MPDETLPFSKTPDGVRAEIRLTPKASANKIAGVASRNDGTAQLRVSVTAVPEKGKANKALLKLLSKSWGVGMRSLSLISGAKDRNKAVLIAGEPDAVYRSLVDWMKSQA